MILAIIIILFILCPLGASPMSEPQTQDAHSQTATQCRDISEILGFAVVNVEDKTVLPFFAKPDSSEPQLTVQLFLDPAINSISHRVDEVG